MTKTAFTMLLGLAVILGGCTAGAVRHETSYSLGTVPSLPPVGQAAKARTSGKVLQVAEVSAPTWLRSRRMLYQLGYHEGSGVAAYTRARWVASPGSLITQQLLQALAGQGAWKAVIGPDATAHADVVLRAHLLTFEQDFTLPKNSHGTLRIQVTLVDAASDKVLADKIFEFRAPAPTPDAEGGVAALDQATRKWIKAVSAWVLQQV